ncbi:hypothetical protein [Actinophytocola sp.]|uniref:hypothetical protein n=1 Tax=Actinophytocola sp. TaxID=1872138 RepID=UPI002ED60501
MSPSTASEITVHRCVVHVVRRGGWSWGPDPRRLLQPILDSLPALIAERFEEQLEGDGPDVVITEPVRVTVRLEHLRARGLAPTNIVVEPAPAAVHTTTPTPSHSPDPPSITTPHPDSWMAPTPATLFAELAERGELEPLLALLPDDTLRTYLLALLEDIPAGSPIDETTAAGRMVAELTRRLPSSSTPMPRTVDGLAQLLVAWPTDRPSPAPEMSSPGASANAAPEATGERHVSSVLPFLLAGPLARIGYLDAIGPALEAVDLVAEAPLFAAALAYKVLGGVERGWRRTAEDNIAAATFAGLESVPDLSGFARRVRPALPVLDGVLALSLCRGHDPAEPLLITGVDGGLLLVDAQGLFPIAWATDVVPYWEACGRPPVAVCDSPLPPNCLRELAAAGVSFITDVRPLRDDPVTRLPWRTPLWTSGEPPLRLAADLPTHTARLAELVQALTVARRAVPLAEDGALERSATLAASLGLGAIAWTLWRADPVLALTRFADLEATVHFAPDAVRVRIPLGRRHADLLRSGALTDVHDVVWLAGRTLTFSGG